MTYWHKWKDDRQTVIENFGRGESMGFSAWRTTDVHGSSDGVEPLYRYISFIYKGYLRKNIELVALVN